MPMMHTGNTAYCTGVQWLVLLGARAAVTVHRFHYKCTLIPGSHAEAMHYSGYHTTTTGQDTSPSSLPCAFSISLNAGT